MITLVSASPKLKNCPSLKVRINRLAAISPIDLLGTYKTRFPTSELVRIKPHYYIDVIDAGPNTSEMQYLSKHGGHARVLNIEAGSELKKIIAHISDEAKSKPALFLDRDDTLNDGTKGIVKKPEDFLFLPGVINGLKKNKRTGAF